MQKRVQIIALEGIDGAGKSTQLRRLIAWFQAQGLEFIATAEPSQGAYGQLLRRSGRFEPLLERAMFLADRLEHVKTCLEPALAAGQVVILDRYFYSSVAYQGSRLDALPEGSSERDFEALQREIYRENLWIAPEADLILYFDLPVERALARMQRGRAQLDAFEKRESLERVARAYRRCFEGLDAWRYCRLDASLSEAELWAVIEAQLRAIFGTKLGKV